MVIFWQAARMARRRADNCIAAVTKWRSNGHVGLCSLADVQTLYSLVALVPKAHNQTPHVLENLSQYSASLILLQSSCVLQGAWRRCEAR